MTLTAVSTSLVRDSRRGLDAESLKRSFINHVEFTQGKVRDYATPRDLLVSLCMTVRDRLIDRWIATRCAYYDNPDTKRVYYLSLEFLMGRTLGNSLINLGLYETCTEALEELGYSLEEIRDLEQEAGLGNGGLGRLAACFLDSMATLELPGYGYGIRYDFGMFQQEIRDGEQIEKPDDWLRYGNPWEIARPEHTFHVQFFGRTESYTDDGGRERRRWVDTLDMVAMPYDTPVPGYHNDTVNTLRLFSAKATKDFDFDSFDFGDYESACEDEWRTEIITKVLYPNDSFQRGRTLRLQQEYLLVSASLQDILDRFRKHHDDWSKLPDLVAIQLNDTHPALAVPELMRLLMDREGLGWDEAWGICTGVFAYTNHTVLPEALECWPIDLIGTLLPRHLEIIYEINRRFLEQVSAADPNDPERLSRMSLIDEGHGRRVRMAHLAIVGSHSVNGVSALHTDIIKNRVLRDFHELFPTRFNNKTNGVTPRRWIRKANPLMSRLITEAIGDGWITDLERLQDLQPFARDKSFREKWREVKQLNKVRLAAYAQWKYGFVLDPGTMYDSQIKRIHDYKRQLLNLLHVITLVNRIEDGKTDGIVPRTVIFAGKAASAYLHAKLMIKLTSALSALINNDKHLKQYLQVFFLPNYGVALAEYVIPATELSEQISMAGMEASGTGNMKFALNGALTIGTLDGANIEIRDAVGKENFFAFGLTAHEIDSRKQVGYNPWNEYHRRPELRRAIDQIAGNRFSPDEPGVYQPLVDRLLHEGDPYMVLADYAAYIGCQKQVNEAYHEADAWTRMSILNVARSGQFSSDRTIREYAQEIWGVRAVPVKLEEPH